MRKNKKLHLLAWLIAAIVTFPFAKKTQADSAPHIIINEVQPAGSTTNEFLEIYNPGDSPIVLDGYKIAKKTKTGSESAILSPSKFLGTINAHGYFLIAHPSYADAISADLTYSGSSYYISNDNTLLLYDAQGMLLDKVGFGAAFDFESGPAPNPSENESLERKAFLDTDSNANDFLTNTTPSPKNSSQTENEADEEQNDGEIAAPDNACILSSPDIKLNEILPSPTSGEEFIELKNVGDFCVDISGWKIMDDAQHQKEFSAETILAPGGYAYLEGNLYLNNDSDIVYLLDKKGSAKSDALESRAYEKAGNGFSYGLDGNIWSWTSTPTPGTENIIINPEKDASSTDNIESDTEYTLSEKIYLSEIFPSPKDEAAEEYLEIANGDDHPIDLFGWTLGDKSKTGKYFFDEHATIEPGGFLTIKKSQSKLLLNNSSESICLYDPENKLVSTVAYEKSIKNFSFNFDGKNWKWSKYLTPGEENKFDSEPVVKIGKPKNVYKNIPAEFSAKAADKETKKLKYVWDFGDGGKSYLKKANHKFLKTGKYAVALSVSDESQTVEKSFAVYVKDSPRADLEIVKIVPNPAGKDENGEIVEIKNNSKKKANLKNWKIATGPGKKMYNHPVGEEFVLNPSETKAVTREISKFSLANKSGKIALVMPDGNVVDKLEYSKEKIADNEAYAKINGKWKWITPGMEEGIENTEKKTEFIDDPSGEIEAAEDNSAENEDAGEVLGESDESIGWFESYNPRFSSENAYAFLIRIGFGAPQSEPNCCFVNDSSFDIAYLLASTI